MGNTKNRKRAGQAVACLAAATVMTATTTPAWGWATAEHVRFGQRIAKSFEDLIGERLPVIHATQGPKTFGHYVSAPDFGRGLTKLLFESAVVGDTNCGVLWNPEGVIDGQEIHDQSHSDDEDGEGSLADKLGYVDCVNAWRLNNSHFGDFAANHYAYYHDLAIEAARRYRATRQGTCRSAAYTLEGWGQHYLTDSVASGHAWNPGGSYDIEIGFQTLSGVQRRMRIHDYLNENGALMAGDLYDVGRFWGDHSEKHTRDALSIPELPDGHQSKYTMNLAQLGLGQVVAAAECGAWPEVSSVWESTDTVRDPRRFYASNHTMCSAMYTEEFKAWLPDFIDHFGVDIEAVLDTVNNCEDADGDLQEGRDGLELAKHYFPDKFIHFHAEDGEISATIDQQALLTLEELDCFPDAEVTPLSAPGESDICGNLLCDQPVGIGGLCPEGMVVNAGCCEVAAGAPEGITVVSEWTRGPSMAVTLETRPATPGGASNYLWTGEAVASFAADGGQTKISSQTPFRSSLGGGGANILECGEQAAVSMFETRVSYGGGGKALELHVSSMDEGLRVQVDGKVVHYLTRKQFERVGGNFVIPLAVQGQEHVVRVTSVNECGDDRPVQVALGLYDTKADDLGDDGDGGGCSVGGTASPLAPLFMVLFVFGFRRRRRDDD